MNTQHVKSYPMLAAVAVAAALTLTACGPQDGMATAATALPMAAPTPVTATVPTPATTQAMQPVPAAQPVAQQTYTAPPASPARVASATLGQVRAIDPIRTRPQGSGAGAVVGGVLGAVLGNQVGHGGGNAAATALGAVGGAVAGNNVERNHKEGISGYRVRVEFDNGSTRTYEESRIGDLRVGDRVRVESGQVRRV